MVIDFSEKVEKFLNEEISWKEIVFDYYVNFIPWINGLLWPLFVLIAVIFFTSRLAKNSEIISVLAAGVSYRRLLVPYLVSAFILSTILWIGNNYIIPNSTEVKNTFENTYIWRGNQKTLNENVHFFINPNEKAFVRYFRLRDSTMIDFRAETFEEGKLVKILKAKRLTYKTASDTWELRDFTVRKFDGLNEQYEEVNGQSVDTTFAFTPEDFIRYSNDMEMMTTKELKEFIDYERDKGIGNSKKYLVEYYRRTADPFTIIILTIIGVSLASRKVRGGLGINLALGLILGSLFVLISKFSITFAYGQTLTPLIGIWIPNIIFTGVAIFLFFKAQK